MSHPYYLKPAQESHIKITFVGVGEAFDAALPNTSLLVEHESASILVDCGPFVPPPLWSLSADPDFVDIIVITHYHGDHTFGLPSLLLKNHLAGRSRPYHILGPPGVKAFMERLVGVAYPNFYQKIEPLLHLEELAPGTPVQATDALRFSCAYSDHPMRNNAVRIDSDTLAVAISGDGAPTPDTVELYDGVELLIHECYSRDYPVGGHVSLATLTSQLAPIAVNHLALVHIKDIERSPMKQKVAQRDAHLLPHIFVPEPGDVCYL